jgi:hypothetical protein
LQAPKSKTNPCHYAPGNHASALLRQLPWRGHPNHCATLCGGVNNNPVALCHPLPYGQRAASSKKDGGALEGKTNNYATPVQGQRCDVGLAGQVTSVTIGPVRPSPPSPMPSRPLHHHPDAVEACGDETPLRQLLYPRTGSRQRHSRVLTRAVAESTPPPSKLLLDAHRTRHDAPPEARFARMVVYSTTLYTMPLHVDEIVRHACKLPPPWLIKGGAVP